MQLSPEESRKAIKRIRKYGGFPPDKYFFSAVELEEFYGLPILNLWECMSKTDEWSLRIPPNTDCKIIYKRPFTKETGAYLIRCKDFERKLIKDVGLPAYAIETHIKICHQGNCPVAVETPENRIASLESQLTTLKSELEQARQEKAALQAELEKTRAELEKARQAEGVNPRSRNTYLKVIAALANRNGKIDLHERGAAVTISRATENFGFPVSEDTTRKIIKEIEELQK